MAGESTGDGVAVGFLSDAFVDELDGVIGDIGRGAVMHDLAVCEADGFATLSAGVQAADGVLQLARMVIAAPDAAVAPAPPALPEAAAWLPARTAVWC